MDGTFRRQFEPARRTLTVAIMSSTLLVVGVAHPGSMLAADAPAAATEPGAAIGPEPRFVISGSMGGSEVDVAMDALAPGIWPDHPSATGLAGATDGPAGLGVIDGCSSNGHFWFFAHGPLDDYDVTVLDTANGSSRNYLSPAAPLADSGGPPVAFLDATAFATCTTTKSKGRKPPRRISGRAIQEQVAGANSCGAGFKNGFVIDNKKRPTYTRDFGRGLKSALRLLDSDADSQSAVFGDRDKQFDATMILWFADDVLSGVLAEGPNGTFPKPGSRPLPGQRPEGDDWDMLIDALAAPPGACVWTSEQRLDKKSRRAAEAFWEAMVGPAVDPVRPLVEDRFEAVVDWTTPDGPAINGGVIEALGAEDGLFTFFDVDDWEVLVKVLDGCSFNDHFWVFAAATTNVEYTLAVTDTETSTVKTYSNELGQPAPAVIDTNAFATCP